MPNHIKGHELVSNELIKFGAFIHKSISNTPFCLLYSSAHPLTEYKIEKDTNIIKKALLEGAFKKPDKPYIIQVNNFSQIFLSGNVPVDPMILKEYSFSVFQVPHHRQRPKLTVEIYKCFPNQKIAENAARLMALYHYRHILNAEFDLLDDNNLFYEKTKSFKSYFMQEKDKFEKGFIKLFLTHTYSPNDPDVICYAIDNPQISWYEKSGREIFSDKVTKAIEEERKRQLDQIAFIYECVEWAYYYREISAELYLVSAGDDYNKIALQAIIGIMIACEWKNISCKFAFTNSGWLNYLGGLMPRVVREYITTNAQLQICFLNNVYGIDGRLSGKPFFTINICNGSNAKVDDIDGPIINIDAVSRTVEVRGMNVFKLEDIRNEEDHRNIGSRISASLKVTLSRHPLEHSDMITDECFLTPYLEYIGYPNPSKPIQMKNVMKCVIGDLLVSQLMNLHKGPSEYFEIIPELLKCKTKGISKFVLNFTKTASVSANVIVYISNNTSLEVSNKKLLNACFEISNAKTSNLKITLHLTFEEKNVPPLSLEEYLNLDGSIGSSLAEYIAAMSSFNSFWNSIKPLTVGETFYVLFKEDYVVSIFKSIPLFLSAKVSQYSIKHYLSYVKLNDENEIEEAHLYTNINSPDIFENENIKFDIKFLSIHLFPFHSALENSVQVKGKGLINGYKVEFSTCLSSCLPQNLDVKFNDLFTIDKAFNILNLQADHSAVEQCVKHKESNSYNMHLIFSQCSITPEVMILTFGDDFDSLECCAPSQLSYISTNNYYAALWFPFSVNTSGLIVGKVSKFSKMSFPSGDKALDCLLYSQSKEKYVANIVLFKDSEYQNGKVILEVVKIFCGGLDKNFVHMLQNILVLHQIALRKLQLCYTNQKINSVNLDLSIEKFKLLSTPCLTLHNASLKVVYSTQGGFTFECQGKLILQLHMHKRLHTYTFKGELILPTETNKGTLHFDNYNNFTLENLVEAFGWVPDKVKSIPILSSALAIAVRNVHIEFSPVSDAKSLQVNSYYAMVYLEELDIGILKLSHIQLELKFVWQEDKEDKFKIYFKLQALISENLFVELEYNPDDHLLHGLVTVCDFKAVIATEGLSVFQFDSLDPSSQSFSNMRMILQDCFMQVFKSSDNKQQEGAGLIASMELKIHMPSKNYKEWSLKHIGLQVKDCLCIRNCLFDTIEFNYSKTSLSSSEAHLMGILRVKSSKESLKITFDLTTTSDKPTILSAKVKPNDDNSSISLYSIFKLVSCIEPGLPKVDLPPIFELLIVDGSVSLTLSPFQVCKYDVAVIIPKWQIFDDPNFRVQDIKIRAVWESCMKMPNLIFDNCTFMFQSWKLYMSGKLMPHVITIKCASNSLPPDAIQFESFLQEYTPKSEHCPTIPSDIDLPQLTVSTIHLGVELKEDIKTFSLTSTISNVWNFNFGDKLVQITKISGSLEWIKQNNNTSRYRAVLYGFFEVGSISVSASMCLGYNIDSILVAEVSKIHYGQIADYLTSQPFDSSLVPQNVEGINSFTAQLVFNVTKKHFFISGSVEKLGKCILLIGYIHDQNDMDYAIMITIGDDFRFSQLSDSLAFVDDYVTVRCANVLVSSVDLDTLKSVIKPFEEASSQYMSKIQNPFITLPKLDNNKLVNNEVRRGTTLYAVLNIHSCRGSKGTIGNLFQLGDQNLEKNDIIIKVFIEKGSSNFLSNIEIFAYLPDIHLCGLLELSMIEMSYQICQKDKDASPDYYLVLRCRVTFGLDLDINRDQSILFDGRVEITATEARCEAESTSRIEKPADINITVKELRLELNFKFCKDEREPDIKIYGQVSIGNFILESMLILKGVSFKVIEITLKSGLTFDVLLTCIGINWAPSFLTFDIKEGKFYYAKEDISVTDHNNQLIHYGKGFFFTFVIVFFDWDFRIEACVPPDLSKLSLSGRSVKKINLGFAKLTGTDAYIHEGPELRYHDGTLSLNVGVELFNVPYFKGSLSYLFHENAVEGTICYLGKILWIKEPTLTVRWSKEEGFQIKEFIIPKLHIAFNLLGAIAKYALVLYKLITGVFSWGIEFKLRTDKNPDPDRYLVKLVFGGNITVSIAGFFTNKVIPLPDIPLRILKKNDFTLSKLPEYICECLWDSAGDICKSLLHYINPIELTKRIAKNIVVSVVATTEKVLHTVGKVLHTVENVANKVWDGTKTVLDGAKTGAKKVLGGLTAIFGFSAFLVDSIQNTVLGYVYAGKDGKKLHNIRYTVDNFGEFLVAQTIEKIAKDVHTNATACMQVVGNSDHCDDLDKLQEATKSLSYELNLVAHDVLAVKYITADCCNDNDVLCITWQVGNSEGEIYDKDTGDIEYHIKVIVIMAQVKTKTVSPKMIYDDMVTPIYPNIKNESKSKDSKEKESEASEKEKIYEEHPSLPTSSSDILIHQPQKEQQHEVEIEASLTVDKEETQSIQSTEDIIETETKMLSANIPIDHAVLEQALCIFVSVKPTVTLRIKTLPPENPRVIDEDMLQTEDKEWMRGIKDEIDKLGREKEVTLVGKTGYFRYFLNPSNTKSELIINASYIYSEETKVLTLKGKLKLIPEAGYYLIQVTDTSDETIMIKSELISPTSPYHPDDDDDDDDKRLRDDNNHEKDHHDIIIDNVKDDDDDNEKDLDDDINDNDKDDDDKDSVSDYRSDSGNSTSDDHETESQGDDSIEFLFDVKLSEIPDDSPGPYSITGYALTEALECLHINTVPNAIMNRCKPPVNIDIELPSSNENSEVTLKWEPGIDQDEHMFEIEISITCTKQNSEIKGIDIGSDFLSKQSEEAFTHPIPASEINKQTDMEDRNKVYYTYKFDLVLLFNKNRISLQTGVVVKCLIFGVSKLSTSLPSLPVSKEFIIVASPPKFEVCLNKVARINPGLKLSWIHTMHAVSYQTELVDKVTKKIKHSREHKFDKNTTEDFSADSVLDIDDLKASLHEDGPKHYEFHMFAQGLGQDLIRSLAPRVAREEVVVSSVDIEYVSAKECILVKFISFTPWSSTTYEVALCQHNNVYSLLSKQTIQVKSGYTSLVYCEFDSHQWKHCIRAGFGVSAYVYACGVNHVFYVGVSAHDLFFLPPPQSITTKVHYKINWLVDHIDMKWFSVRHAECYQFGFQSVYGSSTIWSRNGFGNQAKISNSEFTSMILTSAVSRCFVMSVGRGYKITSNPTTDDITCYQFITGADGRTLTFTSVSLLAMQNLSINLTKISWLLVYKQRVLPRGQPFPRKYFSSRIFKKFWEDRCYDCQGTVVAIMRKCLHKLP